MFKGYCKLIVLIVSHFETQVFREHNCSSKEEAREKYEEIKSSTDLDNTYFLYGITIEM